MNTHSARSGLFSFASALYLAALPVHALAVDDGRDRYGSDGRTSHASSGQYAAQREKDGGNMPEHQQEPQRYGKDTSPRYGNTGTSPDYRSGGTSSGNSIGSTY